MPSGHCVRFISLRAMTNRIGRLPEDLPWNFIVRAAGTAQRRGT